MHKKRKQLADAIPTFRERFISNVLLGVLLLIAGGVIFRQADFDPSRWRAQPGSETKASAVVEQIFQPIHAGNQTAIGASGPTEPAGPDSVPGLRPMGPPEDYDANTLSDKINGKAELYLSAGFTHLRTRRFALTAEPSRWMERYVYDMGRHRNAFAAYSAQRRPNAEPMDRDWAADAYRSANGLFFIHGPYYVEIIASEDSSELRTHMESAARAFAAGHRAAAETLVERRLFPQEHKVPESMVLIAANAFGIEKLDWIYTARYSWGQSEASAFISRRSDDRQAADLAAAFSDYFLEYGGQQIAAADAPQLGACARIISILDTIEVVQVHGPFLFGVHEAETLEQALELAADLQRLVAEAAHE
jgi:hypothetical protein